MMKIIVLGGGDSPEREVSLRSAKSVAAAAKRAGYDVEEIDPKFELDRLNKIANDTIVLPILHGKNGEDGAIQQELEKRQLPFLGSDSNTSKLCFDKWQTHQKLQAAGLPVPIATAVTRESYPLRQEAIAPHVLKIVHGGSSIGTLMVPHPDPTQLRNSRVDAIFQMEKRALIEQLIEGTEVTVPVLDHITLPVIEIIPPENEEFDYRNKYNGRTQEICPPKSLNQEMQSKVRMLAEKVHRTMGARHLSRVDIMVDKNQNLYILEINTMPGMTEQSLYPKAAAVAGLNMQQLVEKFIELVKRDYNL